MFRSFIRQAALAVSTVALGLALAGMVPVLARQPAPKAGDEPRRVGLPIGDLGTTPAAGPSCALATWPYLPAECLHTADGSPVREVRWITIEARISDRESALIIRPASQAR